MAGTVIIGPGAPQQSSTQVGGQTGTHSGWLRRNSRQLPPLQPNDVAMIAAANRKTVSLFMGQISGRTKRLGGIFRTGIPAYASECRTGGMSAWQTSRLADRVCVWVKQLYITPYDVQTQRVLFSKHDGPHAVTPVQKKLHFDRSGRVDR